MNVATRQLIKRMEQDIAELKASLALTRESVVYLQGKLLADPDVLRLVAASPDHKAVVTQYERPVLSLKRG